MVGARLSWCLPQQVLLISWISQLEQQRQGALFSDRFLGWRNALFARTYVLPGLPWLCVHNEETYTPKKRIRNTAANGKLDVPQPLRKANAVSHTHSMRSMCDTLNVRYTQPLLTQQQCAARAARTLKPMMPSCSTDRTLMSGNSPARRCEGSCSQT